MIRVENDDGYIINIPISFNGYKYIDILGFGSTSAVVLVFDENTGERFSAKIIPKRYIRKKNMYNQIDTEINVLRKVNHPNIVKFHEYFEFTNDIHETYVTIIMEYCENGDLLTYLNEEGFKSEEQKKKIIFQFLDAVSYLHKRGIAHGDLKPENILLDSDYNVKLSDFGFSKTSEFAGDESKSGTLYYAAPELFVKGKFNTLKTDIWSIGITLYCMDQSNFPYRMGDFDFIIDQIKSQKFNLSKSFPISLKKIFEKCTSRADERPTIEELIKDIYFAFDEDTPKSFKPDIQQSCSKCQNRYY
ncbi:hypothetical protein M9Y10_037317 [Tritrichomonas musculus]|uniref:Protein kinase domain-containing protein n=1 Tax=Tritrichomonas musculus TaxID=1915356 RepID=A0ABR2GUD1_9EUKA